VQLKNCPRCGKLFSSSGRGLCSQCLQEDARDYDLVRTYLRKNPGANMVEVNRETGVELGKIEEFIRQGRLLSYSKLQVACEICGEPITGGRLCDDCRRGFRSEESEPEKPGVKGRVHLERRRGGGLS
jgi:flagellar operon protein (TIGR03826 family)